MSKINDNRVSWSADVKVALAFKLNGKAVIRSFPDGIHLPNGQILTLTDELICADGAGYTNPTMLRNVLGNDLQDGC